MRRRLSSNHEIMVDPSRPINLEIMKSNLQPRIKEVYHGMTVEELMELRRQQQPRRRQTVQVMEGEGILDDAMSFVKSKGRDAIKFGRNQAANVLDQYGDTIIDSGSNLVKSKLRDSTKLIRGNGNVKFFGRPHNPPRNQPKTFTAIIDGGNIWRKLASGGVKLLGNSVADAIGGASYRDPHEVKHVFIQGNGIFSRLASGGIRFLGNTIANAIGGNFLRKLASGAVRGVSGIVADSIGGQIDGSGIMPVGGSGIIPVGSTSSRGRGVKRVNKNMYLQ